MTNTNDILWKIAQFTEGKEIPASFLTYTPDTLDFRRAWDPLFSHLYALPYAENRRLKIELSKSESNAVTLRFCLYYNALADLPDHDLHGDRKWAPLDTLSFDKRDDSRILGLLHSRLRLSDIFLGRAGNFFALSEPGWLEDDPLLSNTQLHPDRMDEAITLLTYWLMKHAAINLQTPSPASVFKPLSPQTGPR